MSSFIGIGLSLLVALFKSASEIVSKRNLEVDIDPYVNAWALRAFALPLLLVALFVLGVPDSVGSNFWKALAVSGPISIVGTVLYMKGLEASDLSIMSPLAALSPLLVLITSPIIVQEFPSPIGLIGVMLTTVGVYVLELSKKEDGLLEPFRAILREPGAKYMIAMLLLYSVSAPIDKIGVSAGSPIAYTVALHVIAVIGLTPLMLVNGKTPVRELSQENVGLVALIGVLSGISSLIQMTALTFTLVIYVIAIKRAGILFSVAAGSIWFGEGATRQRIIGSFIIVVGLIIISLSLA